MKNTIYVIIATILACALILGVCYMLSIGSLMFISIFGRVSISPIWVYPLTILYFIIYMLKTL